MRSIPPGAFLILTVLTGFNLYAQSPNVKDNPVDPLGLDGFTQAAEIIGNKLQGDPCSGQSYAEQIYCYLGQITSEILPCMYGSTTPQYSLCKTSRSLNTIPSAAEQNILNKLNDKECFINPIVKPVFINSKKGANALKEKMSKTEVNEVLHHYQNGYTLKINSKYAVKGSENEIFVNLRLTDAKGKTLAAPVFLSQRNGYWLFEGCYK